MKTKKHQGSGLLLILLCAFAVQAQAQNGKSSAEVQETVRNYTQAYLAYLINPSVKPPPPPPPPPLTREEEDAIRQLEYELDRVAREIQNLRSELNRIPPELPYEVPGGIGETRESQSIRARLLDQARDLVYLVKNSSPEFRYESGRRGRYVDISYRNFSLDSLERELSRTNREVEVLELKYFLDEVSKAVDSLKRDSARDLMQVKRQFEQKTQEINQIIRNSNVDRLESDLRQAEGQLQRARQDLQSTESDLSRLERELKNIDNELARAKSDLQAAQNQLPAERQNVQRYETELAQVRKRIQDSGINERIEAGHRRWNELNDQSEALRREIKSIRPDKDGYSEEKLRKISELANKESAIRKERDRVADETKALMADPIFALEKEVAAKVQQAQNSLVRLERRIQELAASLPNIENRRTRLPGQISELQRQVQQKRSALAPLDSRVKDAKARLVQEQRDLERRLQPLQRDLQSIQRNLDYQQGIANGLDKAASELFGRRGFIEEINRLAADLNQALREGGVSMQPNPEYQRVLIEIRAKENEAAAIQGRIDRIRYKPNPEVPEFKSPKDQALEWEQYLEKTINQRNIQ